MNEPIPLAQQQSDKPAGLKDNSAPPCGFSAVVSPSTKLGASVFQNGFAAIPVDPGGAE